MAHNLTRRADGTYEFVESTLRGDRAWHRLGATVADRMLSATEPTENGGPLDWEIRQSPLIVGETVREATGWDSDRGEPIYTETVRPRFNADGTPMLAPSWQLNERADTADQFAVVGRDWTPAQNREVARLIDSAAGADRRVVEAAFSLRGGRDVCWALRLSEFEALPGDTLHTFGLVVNSHDGTGSLLVAPTEKRGCCDNARRIIIDNAKLAGTLAALSLRHTANVLCPENVERIRAALAQHESTLAANEEQVRALVARDLSDDELRAYFLAAYDRALGLPRPPSTDTPIGPERDKAERSFERARERFVSTTAEWLGTFHAEREQLSAGPSAWLAYNAVSKWQDHTRGRNADRLHRNLLGSGVKAKAEDYAAALALVGA